MTAGQRSTLSFLDLALIMTGVMAMLVSVGDGHEATAAAISEQFGVENDSRKEHSFAVARFFEPRDARLTDYGKSALAQFAKLPATTRIQIAVPVLADESEGRLNNWETAAARTAAIMYQLGALGIDEQRMIPIMGQVRPSAHARATAPSKDANSAAKSASMTSDSPSPQPLMIVTLKAMQKDTK